MKQKINPQKRKPSMSRANKGEAIRDLTMGRICSNCIKYKERDYFFPHPSGFNGLGSRCKECISLIGSSSKSLQVKKDRYNKRKENKQCVQCCSNELVNNIHCRDCWFIDKASARAGGVKNLPRILALWEEQGGRCFYSGEILVPGDNASLDHQIPRADGGTNNPSNLKWVSQDINLMKSHMNHNEFISMCIQITNRFIGRKL